MKSLFCSMCNDGKQAPWIHTARVVALQMSGKKCHDYAQLNILCHPQPADGTWVQNNWTLAFHPHWYLNSCHGHTDEAEFSFPWTSTETRIVRSLVETPVNWFPLDWFPQIDLFLFCFCFFDGANIGSIAVVQMDNWWIHILINSTTSCISGWLPLWFQQFVTSVSLPFISCTFLLRYFSVLQLPPLRRSHPVVGKY